MAVNTTFSDMANLSWQTLKKEWKYRSPTSNFLAEFITDLQKNGRFQWNDVYLIIITAILFTIHRYLFTAIFLRPIARFCRLTPEGQQKLPESACKLIYYTFFFTYEYYLVNIKYPEFRTDLSSQWIGTTIGMPVPKDIYYIYMLEAGFYFHSIYGTIFMDVWRRDSIPMLFHHVLANSLILFSFLTRYHRIGLIVLYLHDIADVCLESTKIVKYFKDKKDAEGKPSMLLEWLSAIGFFCFSAAWFWCRLILYLQLVLFSSLHYARAMLPNADFYFFFNGMLIMLFLLNVWWFHFIVALVLKIATGTSNGIEDTREYRADADNNKIDRQEVKEEKKTTVKLKNGDSTARYRQQ